MFLNVHLTQGRTDISLLLPSLSFNLCWLILLTRSISPYNTLYSIFIHHLLVAFSPQTFITWLIFLIFWLCLMSLSIYFSYTNHIVILLLMKIKRTETNEVSRADCIGMRCGCQAVVRSIVTQWMDRVDSKAAGINMLHFCRIWNLFLNSYIVN